MQNAFITILNLKIILEKVVMHPEIISLYENLLNTSIIFHREYSVERSYILNC